MATVTSAWKRIAAGRAHGGPREGPLVLVVYSPALQVPRGSLACGSRWSADNFNQEAFMNALHFAAGGLALSLGTLLTAPVWAADYTAVMSPDIKWMDAPSIGPGAKTAVIDGDPKSSGPFVMRLKVPPNTKIKVHTHPADENVTILSGTLYFSPGDKFEPKMAKAFGPGSYFSIAKGKPMFAYTKDKEAVAQLHGNGPWGITYLDSAGAPEKKK